MSGHKILVVEDEKDIVRLIKYNFEKDGHKVVAAHDGESGLALARKEKPDLIILDIMLPKMDGLEFCRTFRQESQVPILFLTAKKSEVDRILGLKLGADDYVTKPFSVGELIARVEAVLRRAGSAAVKEPVAAVLRAGELEVDAERHEVRIKGRPTTLTPKEFEFLRLLFRADGKVLSRDTLLERIWGYDKSMDIDTRTVDQHIARLRKKLRSEGQRILTVTNAGYRIKLD
ncbi:MAG: DNA-binding response regulator [Elusimicrobia bacterium CG1_02_63_36]|nr:MAG: DNA-binding response regulator [Elusimicrobia bacterium CG1_02_63_36]PIP83922.1 MAG: DNA-binding response regulator [Elusimicrobia bacterium CG22_combo_CG10-13_8_21_14_all_63_91]PJA14883.1 MAG: DNA-binding response regulator [Elusimicrobia bacterium CG_4_10_14_0_2_um_filter_63_34]PJB26711.1 MAG: DNA-binding response regulator [Elusimicrobia bacterium CG_4_9_14_3_um_filter_62_55]